MGNYKAVGFRKTPDRDDEKGGEGFVIAEPARPLYLQNTKSAVQHVTAIFFMTPTDARDLAAELLAAADLADELLV